MFRPYYSQEEEFNMFFEESVNLVQDAHGFKMNILEYDLDMKEESELFSKTTMVS